MHWPDPVRTAYIFYLRPNTITVTDAAGNPLNPYDLSNYSIASVESNPVTTLALQTGAQASIQREFRGRVPVVLKGGLDFRMDQRDQKQANVTYPFLGADGRASTTPVGNDDGAARFLGEGYSRRPGVFGFPGWQRIDNEELWDYAVANPTHISSNAVAHYLSQTNGSKYAEELFGNISIQRPVGDATANFQGFIPRKASWGFALVREKFNFRMNWSHQDRNRLGERTGNSIGPGTWTFQSSRVFLDILGEYYLTKRFGVYFTLRNVGDTPDQREVEGPLTPSHAQFRSREQAGSLWTFGIKGKF